MGRSQHFRRVDVNLANARTSAWFMKSLRKDTNESQIITRGLIKGFTMVAYSPRLWLMAAGETSSTNIKN
eukprot:1150293-Pelagomonas_calceolata.AAC.1